MRCLLSLFDWPRQSRVRMGEEAWSPFLGNPSFSPCAAYLGMMRSGASRMARQPSAQNAYAPCASASG